MSKRLCFLAVFLAMALALCVSAAGATDAPAAAQPTVKLWAFYDKDVNAYPTGWNYLDPVITDPSAWQQDSPWLPFPSPHYMLYAGTWGSEEMGALIQEGDFGPGVAEIPLADGLYWVVLSAPPGDWHLTTDALQKVYVWNGNVYVQMANEGLWYGDKVLVGITSGAPACGGWLELSINCGNGGVSLYGYGFLPNHCYTTGGNWDGGWTHTGHCTDSSGSFSCGPPYLPDPGTYTVWARDETSGCVVSRTFTACMNP